MAEQARPRVPIKPGFFTIPDDPSQAPRLLGTKCRACGEHFYPRRAICGKCMSEQTARRRAGRARDALQLHLRALAAVRLDEHGARRRLRRRADRPARRAARPGAAGRQAGGVPRRPGASRASSTCCARTARSDIVIVRFRPLEGVMRDVAVLGVGMHRFGAYYGEKPNAEMALRRRDGGAARCRAGVQGRATRPTSATSSPR